MFVLRSRYDGVKKECEGLLAELEYMRGQYASEVKKSERLQNSVESLYEDAKTNAEAKSKLATALGDAKVHILGLEKQVEALEGRNFDIEEFLEPSPTDPEERAVYVGRIAGYFNGGLMDYLKYTLSNFKTEIARFPLTERETDFYRAGVNLCYLLTEWGDEMIREHYGNIREAKEEVGAFDAVNEEEDSAVASIKKAVNN